MLASVIARTDHAKNLRRRIGFLYCSGNSPAPIDAENCIHRANAACWGLPHLLILAVLGTVPEPHKENRGKDDRRYNLARDEQRKDPLPRCLPPAGLMN